MNRAVFFALFVLVMPSMDANAEWVASEDTYSFGPEMSEAEACKKAERRAKEKALKSVSGEQISSEDNMVCSEMRDVADCSLNRFTWSIIDGLIKNTRNKKEFTGPGIGKYKQCKVSLEVDIGVAEGKADPSFDLRVELNRRTFRNGETLEIKLQPTQAMNINVFQYLPYMDPEKQVTRIFPNAFDKKQLFKKPGTVPTREGRQQYGLMVGFPEDVKKSKKLVDEYLMVLGTKKPFKFREEYSLQDFNARLLEIPRQDRRIVRRAYNVVRQK
jgi:hypothetical protein